MFKPTLPAKSELPTPGVAPPKSPRWRRPSKRTTVLLLAALLMLGALIVALLSPRSAGAPANQKSATTPKTVVKDKAAPEPTSLRLIASGDTIAHDALNLQAKQADGSYDYYQFMKPLQPYFDKADVRFCNQAVPGGGPAFGIRGYPIFNSPFELAHGLNKLGCNVVNTGTNHTFDLGQAVIDAQLNDWDKQPYMLAIAGANRSPEEQNKIRYFTSQKVKFAFLSYSTYSNISPPNSYGLNMFNEAVAQQQISQARAQADIVIVSMRWGTEYSPAINGAQERAAQLLASWGTDIVLGHGPHVVEPVKQLQGKDGHTTLVWYSIGNFLNAQLPVDALVSGLAIMDIDIATKKVQPPKYLPIYMHYEWTASQKAAQDLLTRRNFTMVPLDQAADLLAKSQNGTTVAAQTDYLQKLLNQFTPVQLVDSKTY